ncbi:hypothetical protein [Pseudomonas kulmbachensis]|uniref:hypothetical protein n=1 Tax=Pseudomonas kulmbachensis TaxID=3043408 RepID=UPI002AB21492|nr:hypothetical protein [Pseudomonas sp. FLM 004-28]
MNRFIAVGTLALLSGCAVNNTLPERSITDAQDYLMPIHVMVDDPLRAAPIRNQLRETGVFRSIESGTGKPGDYAVLIKFKSERDLPPFPVVLLSAATLFLLPLSQSIDTTTEFSLKHDGKLLKQYNYRNVTQKYTWLLDQSGDMADQNVNRIARAFAQDVQRDGLVPAEHPQ